MFTTHRFACLENLMRISLPHSFGAVLIPSSEGISDPVRRSPAALPESRRSFSPRHHEPPLFSSGEPMGALAGFDSSLSSEEPMGALAGFELFPPRSAPL